MADKDIIYNQALMYNEIPMPFVIKTMEEMDVNSTGLADPPHRHKYYSVIWSLAATGKHIIDFREYPIRPNDIFFVSPEQVHQVITEAKPHGYVILFTPEFLEKNSIRNDFIANLKLFQKSDETPPLQLKENMARTLKVFADQMMTAFHSGNDMAFETIGAYLKLFLIECNGHCSLFPGSNTQSIEVGKTLVKSFKNIVETNYTKWHQVKEYADNLSVTPNYLNEVIKSATNVSAKEFIQNRIILEAKRLLIFTDKSGKEIGFDLGFEDPSHFSKFFKSNTGQSLQEFKDSIVK
jgi:AraC family transcriptional regulator, transcriptional activator of pobA